MPISKLTSDDLREPGRENTVLAKLNEALTAINGAAGSGTPGPGTFTTLSANVTRLTVTESSAANDTTTGAGLTVNDATPTHGLYVRLRGGTAGISGESYCTQVMCMGGNAMEVYTDSPILCLGTASTARITIGQTSTAVSHALTLAGALDHDGSTAGFYGTTPIAKQTGVAVTAPAIHAALVALGLIAA